MTQIIAALTQEYVLVASDRQLTVVSGPRKGQVEDDHTCKLVSLCGIWGIAYTGFAHLQGVPTHEWIAVRLAENGCQNAHDAAQILAKAAAPALRETDFPLELTFLIAGWARLPDVQTLQPHFLLVSNMYDLDQKRRATPGPDFNRFERKLKPDEAYAGHVIGQPLPKDRGKHLHSRILKFLTRPKSAMRTFASEIANTSRRRHSVGDKVLAFSIPKLAAERAFQTGNYMMLATEPDLLSAAFCYFDPAYSQLGQYGPTFTCGGAAVTDVETETEPARDSQSSSFRILHFQDKSTVAALVRFTRSK